MRTLEDRLSQASDDARLQVDQIDARSATSIGSRQQRRRTLVGTVAVAAMFIVFGATAMVMPTRTGQNGATQPSTPPTTAAPVPLAEASTPPPASSPAANDITHLVSKITASSELSAEFGATKLIDGDLDTTWHDASLGGSGAEIVIEFTEPVSIEEIVIHPYRDEDRFLRNFWVQRFELRTSNQFETLDNHLNAPITGTLTREMEPQTVGMYTAGSFSLSFKVVSSFPAQPVDDGPPFDELAIAEIQVFGTPISGTNDSETATTTTIIVAEPKLPPALRGTPLTTAWGEYVVETMAMADYEMAEDEIADMDVFEKEMDRGLVHATFTVDGNEWVLAFGPWRDGEYSDDPAVLQDHFFTEKPVLDTTEGLLLMSERSDPSYVYLAMDVGKIAISFQPDVIGSAVPFGDLEALALDLAPIARLLLEADLIEWNT